MSDVVRSHTLSLGIVGLPNSGKSTLFNALTEKSVPAENYPFCTLDKNVGVVQIPDSRLEKLANFLDAQKVVPSSMTFVDIAGLVKGASQGEGLGNQFLSHIREVDVILYVLRAFKSEQIVHVYNRVDPIDDFEIVQSKLIIKDLEVLEKRLDSVKRNSRSGITDTIRLELDTMEKAIKWLGEGKPVIDMTLTEEESDILNELFLLTNKQRVFILNYKEGVEGSDIEEWENTLAEISNDKEKEYILRVDVKLLSDLAQMEEDEMNEYIQLLGKKPTTVEDVITTAYKRLNLITFYTGSSKECNAWSIEKGATVKSAASVIHTDLGKNFITADIVNIDDMIEAGGWVASKEKGLVKNHGKEYIVQDADYVIILANT
jgi:GTP-binding protein YchF